VGDFCPVIKLNFVVLQGSPMRIYLLLVAAAVLAATLSAQVSPPAVGTLPPETVIATVNGKDVTAGDVMKMFQSHPSFAESFEWIPRGPSSDSS
jgi:hypothetical protein